MPTPANSQPEATLDCPPDTHGPLPSVESATKPWWQSKTVIGAGAVLAATVAKQAGVEIGPDALTDTILSGIQFIGGLVAIYGRIAARTQLTK